MASSSMDSLQMDAILWEPPRNWAPHEFAPAWHMLADRMRDLHAAWSSRRPLPPAACKPMPVEAALESEPAPHWGVTAGLQCDTSLGAWSMGEAACGGVSRRAESVLDAAAASEELLDHDGSDAVVSGSRHICRQESADLAGRAASGGSEGSPSPCTPSSSGRPVSVLTSSPAESTSVVNSPVSSTPGSPVAGIAPHFGGDTQPPLSPSPLDRLSLRRCESQQSTAGVEGGAQVQAQPGQQQCSSLCEVFGCRLCDAGRGSAGASGGGQAGGCGRVLALLRARQRHDEQWIQQHMHLYARR